MDSNDDNYEIKRKADRYIISELMGKAINVKDVLIELFLPHNDSEEIFLICKPNKLQFMALIKEHEFNIVAHDEFGDGSINNKYYIKRAFRKKSNTTFYTSKLSETMIILQAYDLMIICERDNILWDGKTEGYFTIFNNFQLPPLKSLTRKHNGEVIVDPRDRYTFKLESGLELTFDIFYRYENEEDYTKSYPYAVAEFKNNLEPERINEIIIEIDDLLRLISLALEKVCVCTGWVAYSNTKSVVFYRRDRVIPEKDEGDNYYHSIIEPFEVNSFIECAYKAFTKFNDKELLRNILTPLVRSKKLSVETHYLILFAILESIVLNYKKLNKYEPILTRSLFNDLKKDLGNSINSKKDLLRFKLALDDEEVEQKIKYMSEKLSELNRISFNSSFELFQKQYNIPINDLWPLYDTKESTTLAQIRNKIIHGETFSNHQFQAISFALHHLQIILERMVLSLLGWDISNSRVSLEYTRQNYSKLVDDIKYYQNLFN